MSKATYTVTAALPYANGPLHLGHVAGVYLPADIFVRFLRMNGHDVAFICGSDEHGAAITLRAKKEGLSPRDIVDKYDGIIRQAFSDFNISFDIFHRTSSELHHQTSADFFKRLHDQGQFTEEVSEQYFDEEFQQFLADRYITGTCPKCQSAGAYGDQCEKCGSDLSPTDLINPISTLSGKTPVLRTTSHWYLPMNQHETWLKEWIQEGILDGEQQHNPKEWRNQVIGQCMSWINGGLRPRAMTRDLDWGVKVPLPGADGKVLYVWLDAPIGYMASFKNLCDKKSLSFDEFWSVESTTELYHFIGKDIIYFHSLFWPAMLEGAGYRKPNAIFAHGFVTVNGAKMSKSRGTFIKARTCADDVLSCNNAPSSVTARGHQFPMAFLCLASGLAKHGGDSAVPMPRVCAIKPANMKRGPPMATLFMVIIDRMVTVVSGLN
mgnify:CR=1 FL=1